MSPRKAKPIEEEETVIKKPKDNHYQLMVRDKSEVLRILYRHGRSRRPAGLDIEQTIITMIPSWMNTILRCIIHEFRNRQMMKKQMSQESLAQWETIVKQYPTQNLGWFRENLPSLLDSMKPKPMTEPVNQRSFLLKQERLLHKGTEWLINDRKEHHLIADTEPGYIICFLTSQRYFIGDLETV
jgi:hypothetical protein